MLTHIANVKSHHRLPQPLTSICTGLVTEQALEALVSEVMGT